MRNIKFRVFDKENCNYFRGWDDSEITITFFHETNDKSEIGYIQFKDLGCTCNPDDACGGCEDIWTTEALTKDSIIEQFTGLTDEYNTDIYEGDIMLYLDQPRDKKLEVVWTDTGWGLLDGDKPFKRRFDKLIVLGNIHENPELLEVTK